MRMGMWVIVYGGPAEVDVASIRDIELPEYNDEMIVEDEDGMIGYDSGSTSVAILG